MTLDRRSQIRFAVRFRRRTVTREATTRPEFRAPDDPSGDRGSSVSIGVSGGNAMYGTQRKDGVGGLGTNGDTRVYAAEPRARREEPGTVDSVHRIRIRRDTDIVVAREEGRRCAATLRFASSDLTFIAAAISEVARNLLTHAGSGEISIGIQRKNGHPGIVIGARDDGPGIADIQLAMRDGYSSSGGLGRGLPGVRRLMDEFDIRSEPGTGTVVTMGKWIGGDDTGPNRWPPAVGVVGCGCGEGLSVGDPGPLNVGPRMEISEEARCTAALATKPATLVSAAP